MPEKIIKSFEVKYLQILREDGAVDDALMPPLSNHEIKGLFEKIILTRTFNERALDLQREGRIGTYPSLFGQEAAQIGSAVLLKEEDWVFPSFREAGVYIVMGFPMWMLFRYWAGDERGMKVPEGINIFPVNVPVGSQIPHAVGAGLAAKLKGDRAAIATYFGDGATSRGDFHEGMNLAGVYKLPVVFICQNNQWAISVPRSKQTAAETIAQKAMAYGFEGIQVDGNDVFAVYRAVRHALEKAREDKGPTLVECFTYRLDDHTTADDASRYRSREEVEAWKRREPLLRLRIYMERRGLWDKGYEDDIRKRAEALVDKAIEEEESMGPSTPLDIIRYTYKDLTARQARELKEFGWHE